MKLLALEFRYQLTFNGFVGAKEEVAKFRNRLAIYTSVVKQFGGFATQGFCDLGVSYRQTGRKTREPCKNYCITEAYLFSVNTRNKPYTLYRFGNLALICELFKLKTNWQLEKRWECGASF